MGGDKKKIRLSSPTGYLISISDEMSFSRSLALPLKPGFRALSKPLYISEPLEPVVALTTFHCLFFIQL